MKYLLDTNIIIYYLNGDKIAIDFINNHINSCAISVITYLEVLVYPYNEEEEKIVRDFLGLFKIFNIDLNITNSAIQSYRKKKIKIADNLIGATAKYNNLTLVTRNTTDFKEAGVNILNLYGN